MTDKNIAIITLHGMGDAKPGYSDKLKKKLEKKFSTAEWACIHFCEVNYQAVVNQHHQKYFERAKKWMRWLDARRWLLTHIGDAATLETGKYGNQSAYYLTQVQIKQAFEEAYANIGPDGKVIILAQSLGGQVISNYLWDAQQKRNRGKPPNVGIWAREDARASSSKDAFCRGGTVVALVTTGCNIPMFIAGHDAQTIHPISMPREDFVWLNYYDKDDVLGWPLEPLNAAYRSLVKDIRINSGNLLSSWNMMSHTGYWKDDSFLKPFAGLVKKLE